MKKNNKKGFTLVELVIVVAVMAILVAVAIPTVKSITESAQDSVEKTNARTIEALIKVHEAEVNAGTAKDAAGNSVTTFNAGSVQAALIAGKLGIDGTFKYDGGTGIVTAIESTDTVTGTSNFKIVCDTTPAEGSTEVVVTPGT